MPRFRFTGLVALLVALALPFTAFAQEEADAPDPRVEEARTLFEQADLSFAAGNFVQAAEGFQRSHDLLAEAGRETAPLVWFNVARAWDEAERLEEALRAYESFINEVDAQDDSTRDRVHAAEERAAEIRESLASRGASPPAPARETSTGSGGGGISPIGPIVLGAGGALVIVGAILGGVALANRSSAEERCVDMRCPPDVEATNDDIATQALVADIFLFTGAAAAVAGLVLTFVLTEDSGESRTAVRGTCGPGGCLALVEGSF